MSSTKKLTQNFINEEYAKKGYKVISKYINAQTPLFVEDGEGYIYKSNWNKFQCNKNISKFHKSNPYTIQNIKLWMKTNAVGYELLSEEYINNSTKLLFKCPEGHKFEMNWSNFQCGKRCPYCSNPPRKIELGITTIWDTDRWMCDLGVSEEDAKTYSRCSNEKIFVTCPYCGNKKKIMINSIYKTKSIGCTCGDGVSYPEKFIISILNQLNINYQHDSYWIKNKRYDFYFEYHGKKYVLECHGEQHYRDKTGLQTTLKEQIKNDEYKETLALQNNIIYISLDCRYSDLKYIKNNILNSELTKIFDLSNIDWVQCEEFALSNRVKEVCDYWKEHDEINNEKLTTTNIGKMFNLNRITIRKYLKQGTKLGWCNYDPKKAKSIISGKNGKSTGKPVEIFKDEKSLGVFPSCCELERQSEELFGVKLLQGNISAVCRGEWNQYYGFTFRYTNIKK